MPASTISAAKASVMDPIVSRRTVGSDKLLLPILMYRMSGFLSLIFGNSLDLNTWRICQFFTTDVMDPVLYDILCVAP